MSSTARPTTGPLDVIRAVDEGRAIVASGQLLTMVASVPVCTGDLSPTDMRIADRIALSVGRTREQIMAERDRVAFGIGRHPTQQREALANRIHGK